MYMISTRTRIGHHHSRSMQTSHIENSKTVPTVIAWNIKELTPTEFSRGKQTAKPPTHKRFDPVTSLSPTRTWKRLSITARACMGILIIYGLTECWLASRPGISNSEISHLSFLNPFACSSWMPFHVCRRPLRLTDKLGVIRICVGLVSTALFGPLEVFRKFRCCSRH